jgi:PAS domain S-box-containing protein
MSGISDNKKNTLRLGEELRRLRLEVSASKVLQRKKDALQKKYLNSQTRFKTIFDRSCLGKKFIDENLKITKVNNALVELLGYTRNELVGSRITDIAHPDFVESWKTLQHELWSNKKPSFSIDTCIVKKDKSIIWCHITSILFEDNGAKLGHTVLEDITKRKTLENDIKEANNRERLFQQQLLQVTVDTQERERARIAEDLHNSLWQSLYGVTLSLDAIKLENSEQQKDNLQALKRARAVLFECISQSKRISHGLMPPILEDFGLKEAIQDICIHFSGSVRFKTHFTGLHKRLPKYLEIALFRIAQELIMNVIKHSGATICSLALKISKTGIVLRVEDNGRGFQILKDGAGGVGTPFIKNKVQILNGQMDISSKKEEGTIVNIILPQKLN